MKIVDKNTVNIVISLFQDGYNWEAFCLETPRKNVRQASLGDLNFRHPEAWRNMHSIGLGNDTNPVFTSEALVEVTSMDRRAVGGLKSVFPVRQFVNGFMDKVLVK